MKSKRESTIQQWDALILKAEKRLEESRKCFELYGDEDSKSWVEEDEKKLEELKQNKQHAIDFMERNRII